jgi:phage terminase small subunit
MSKNKNLTEIAEYVEKEAIKCEITLESKAKKEFSEVKEMLEKNSIVEEIDFTLTIGNLNAYLG